VTEDVALDTAIAKAAPDWDQGDIVDAVYFAATDDSGPAVLVTPACDIEHGKVDLWTFVRLYPDTEIAAAVVAAETAGWQRDTPLSRKQQEQVARKVTELIGQKYPRYHWVPVAIGAATTHVADFSCITCLPAAEVKEKATRVGRLTSSWREQLPARYVAFMGRVGTLDFMETDLAPHVARLAAAAIKSNGGHV